MEVYGYHYHGGWVMLHVGSCGHCNNGQGREGKGETESGKWIGPMSEEEAKNYATSNDLEVYNCQHCL